MVSRQNFQTISHKVIGRGVDNHSTFNNIQQGFSSSIVNMDCAEQGYLEKRKGYQGFFGDVPLRIESIERNANNTATLSLDTEVNLLLAPSTPVALWGDPLQDGTGTLTSVGTTVTGSGTAFTTQLKVGSMVRANGEERLVRAITNDTSLELDEPFYPDLSADSFTFRTTMQFFWPEFTNESKITLSAGHVGDFTVDFPHNTSNLLTPINIVKSTSTSTLDNSQLFPDSVIWFDNNLDADITFNTEELDEDLDVYIVTEDTDFTDDNVIVYTANLTTTSTGTVTFNIPAATHALPNLNIIPLLAYQDPNNLDQFIQVIPDEFIIEDDGDLRIDAHISSDMLVAGTFQGRLKLFDMSGTYAQEYSFTAGTDRQISFSGVVNAFNFTAFYLRNTGSPEQNQVIPDSIEYDDSSQELRFTFTIESSGTLKAIYMPGVVKSNQITVSTVDYPNLVDDSLPQTVMWGIPNEDIVYRESANKGGEITGLYEYSSPAGKYLAATSGGVLYKETQGELTLPSTEVSIRRRILTGRVVGPFLSDDVDQTRSMSATNITDGTVPVVSITNNKDETISVVASVVDKVGTWDDLVIGRDLVTLSGTEQSHYLGSWAISSIDDITNTLVLSIPDLPRYIPNETDTGAKLGVFTDSVEMSPNDESGNPRDLPFLADDVINSTLFVSRPLVSAVVSNTLWIKDLKETSSLPSGARLSAERTTSVLPVEDTSTLVRGDMVTLSGYTRQARIISVDPDVSITIDESILIKDDPADRTEIKVPGRWISVESPDYNERKFIYWDTKATTAQDRIRAAAINDSLFLTNYTDPVMKFDGESLYRAGLPAFQPSYTSWVDSTQTGIVIPKICYLSVSHDGTHSHIYFSELPNLGSSDPLYEETTDTTMDVRLVNESERYIEVEGNVVGVIPDRGQVSVPQEVGYYFKIQAVDRNNNVIASAVTDWEECIVPIATSGAINHRLSGLPKFDIYDYDRLDVYVYRTKVGVNAIPPFFQVRRDAINYRYMEGEDVLVVNDTTPDESLSPIPDDQVSIALKGAELPLSSDEPPRSKYITTAGNRMVLGNIKSYNTLELDLLSNRGISELNTVDDLVIDITEGDNTVVVDCIPFLNRAGSVYDTLNSDHMMEITSADFTDDTVVELTLNGSIGVDLTGEFIQLGSWFTSDTETGTYTSAGRSRDDNLGGLIGWWQINSHTVDTNDVVELFWVHGKTASDNWTFGASEAPLYLAHSDGKLPVVTLPYALSHIGNIVEDVVFDDRNNQFEFTTAINRAVKDIRSALNQYMNRQEEPWLLPKAGATEGSGNLTLQAVRPDKTLTGTATIGADSDLQIFWDRRRTASGNSYSGTSRLYPSRLLVSVANYPEMFDNPFAVSALTSDSVIDVNANDGQEITGMSTFFSTSTTSASALEETLVVFKDRSIYAVNLTSRQIQEVQSGEQGCSIPGSINVTRDGIMFANTSGIYMVTKNLDVVYVGDWIENTWKNNVNFDTVAERAIGVNDALDRKYKLSLPTTEAKNEQVAVFNYISASKIGGGWSFHDNFPASDWRQTNEGTFFSTYQGRVFRLRDAGDATDYRDDDNAINARLTYAPQSFGDTGSRAVLNRVITHIEGTVTDLVPSFSTDLSTTFETVDAIGTESGVSGESIASSLPERHALYFQVQYTHSVKDEGCKIGGIDFRVTGLSELGITQAKDS